MLRRRCRFCAQPISVLYPFIELLTAVCLTALFLTVRSQYWISYAIFISGLIVTIRTDIESLLICRYATLALIPIGFLLSLLALLPISLCDSVAGAIGGYLVLWCIARIFYWGTGKQGMGQGDLELLAFIGSFTGVLGVWLSLLLGSVLGSCVGLIALLLFKKDRSVKLPFGAFLAGGALIYLFYGRALLKLLSKIIL